MNRTRPAIASCQQVRQPPLQTTTTITDDSKLKILWFSLTLLWYATFSISAAHATDLTFGSEVFAVCPDLESHFVLLPPPSSGARDSRLSCSTLRKAKTTRIERMQYTVLLADPIPDLDIP